LSTHGQKANCAHLGEVTERSGNMGIIHIQIASRCGHPQRFRDPAKLAEDTGSHLMADGGPPCGGGQRLVQRG
jgi:hypothetical protein